jgi:hypothetical protein
LVLKEGDDQLRVIPQIQNDNQNDYQAASVRIEQTAESKRHFRLPVAIRVLLLHLHFGGLGLHPLFSKR